MGNDNNQNVNYDTFDFMKKEWDLSWAHINNIARTYWALFLSIIAFNGIIIKHYLEKDALKYSIYDGIVSIFVLIVNSLILLIYQREHYARKENYFTIDLIRKKLMNSNNSLSDWNHFYNTKINTNYEKEFSSLIGKGYEYYTILKFVFAFPVPTFIFYKLFANTYDISYAICIIITFLILLFVLILFIIIYILSFRKGKAMIANFNKIVYKGLHKKIKKYTE